MMPLDVYLLHLVCCGLNCIPAETSVCVRSDTAHVLLTQNTVETLDKHKAAEDLHVPPRPEWGPFVIIHNEYIAVLCLNLSHVFLVPALDD